MLCDGFFLRVSQWEYSQSLDHFHLSDPSVKSSPIVECRIIRTKYYQHSVDRSGCENRRRGEDFQWSDVPFLLSARNVKFRISLMYGGADNYGFNHVSAWYTGQLAINSSNFKLKHKM